MRSLGATISAATSRAAMSAADRKPREADFALRLKIVGSAAGGGFPQWNCNYRLSRAARAGASGVRRRTQSSLAASADGRDWVLFNASPDIRQQIAQTPELQPAADAPLRSTPIRAVVLTNADVDHVAGLLSLRERQPFAIYASAQVLAALEANSIFNVLDPAIVPRRDLPAEANSRSATQKAAKTGVRIESFAVPGKVALYMEDPAGRTPISAPTRATRSAYASPAAMAAARSSTSQAARGSMRTCAHVSTAPPACSSTARSLPTTK